MSAVRVVLVDDNPDFVGTAADFMAQDPGIEIVGLATSGERALELVAAHQPDLVVMDLAMPGMGGLEAARRLKACRPAPLVIILSLHDDEAYRRRSRQAGADGFIAKSEFGEKLLPLIHRLSTKQAA
ncbi:MAG: response regulator transcription factor [Anaerolineae bacterium]|jgi:two-component system invasion response regulator UvrY